MLLTAREQKNFTVIVVVENSPGIDVNDRDIGILPG
jgi:hypothetical protein